MSRGWLTNLLQAETRIPYNWQKENNRQKKKQQKKQNKKQNNSMECHNQNRSSPPEKTIFKLRKKTENTKTYLSIIPTPFYHILGAYNKWASSWENLFSEHCNDEGLKTAC